MNYQQELQLAEAAWDATKRDDQSPYAACSPAWKETLNAKVKSVEAHGPAEGDAFEQEVAELLVEVLPAASAVPIPASDSAEIVGVNGNSESFGPAAPSAEVPAVDPNAVNPA